MVRRMGRTAYVNGGATVVASLEIMRLSLWLVLACVAASLGAGATAHARGQTVAWHRGVAVVAYSSEAALRRALERHPAEVVRRIPELRAVEVRPPGGTAAFAAALRREPGIVDVAPVAPRVARAEPG